MFDQIACDHIQHRFRQQSDGGPKEIGPGGNITEVKAEINYIGGNDIDTATEYHGPHSIFLNAGIDSLDELFFTITLPEIGGKCKPDQLSNSAVARFSRNPSAIER